MDIHHYTSALTLPLILQSGKMRFTRADLLDDGSEMPFNTSHINASNFYVSSWTSVLDEHSGQWFRYGNQHQGIRITLPITPFEFHQVNFDLARDCVTSALKGSKVGIHLENITMPFTTVEMLGNGYVIIPYTDNMSESFGGKVEYVDNPASRAAELFSANKFETNFSDSGKLGRIKSKDWADQAEYRFVLMAMNGPNLDRSHSQKAYDEALLNLYENNLIASSMEAPAAKFIDLPIATDSLNRMTVTLGSHISNEDRNAIMEAISLHAPSIRVFESNINLRRQY